MWLNNFSCKTKSSKMIENLEIRLGSNGWHGILWAPTVLVPMPLSFPKPVRKVSRSTSGLWCRSGRQRPTVDRRRRGGNEEKRWRLFSDPPFWMDRVEVNTIEEKNRKKSAAEINLYLRCWCCAPMVDVFPFLESNFQCGSVNVELWMVEFVFDRDCIKFIMTGIILLYFLYLLTNNLTSFSLCYS